MNVILIMEDVNIPVLIQLVVTTVNVTLGIALTVTIVIVMISMSATLTMEGASIFVRILLVAIDVPVMLDTL